MKRQKQDTIMASFSRQQKPMVKRAKGNNHEVHAPATRGRSLHLISTAHAEENDDFNGQFSQDADGTVTDVDMMSSQEDASSQSYTPTIYRTDRMTKPVVPVLAATTVEIPPTPTPTFELLHKTKDVKDSVHGIITFEPLCWKIIDTPQFQRLRHLYQLGAASHVYIGATHTRFEHSLGVAHLAEKMVMSIRQHQPYLPITDRDVLCIKIAGLCHDLGHGPFSHVFDGIYMKQLRRRKADAEMPSTWTHEQGSLDMFGHLLRANHINVTEFGLENIDEMFIKELIYGGPLPGSAKKLYGRTQTHQQFLYDFVNNAISGLDVDKLDYFMRDAQNTGAKASCDVDLLVRNARVLRDQDEKNQRLSICFPEKLAGQVMQAFRARFELHQTVYQHKTVRSAEYMLCDALLAADDHLRVKGYRISDIVHRIEAYQHLDDRILAQIEASDSEELSEARAILMRKATRSLYDFVGTTTVTSYSRGISEDQITKEILDEAMEASNYDLDVDNLIVEFVRVHYGKGEDDPVSHVRFYAKASNSSSECYKLSPESYAMHLPSTFQDHSIRVYVKEKHLVRPARDAFIGWSRERNGSSVRPRNLSD